MNTIAMRFEIVTDANIIFGPFADKNEALKAADDLGLGEARALNDDSERGWEISIVNEDR